MLSNEKELKILEDFCNLGAIPKENIYEMILHVVEDAGLVPGLEKRVKELERDLLEAHNEIDDLGRDIRDLEDDINDLDRENHSLKNELKWVDE